MRLVSTITWSALATIIRLANGFISTKVVAVIIGPLGVALVGQFYNLNTIIMTLALGGISSGVIKYTAEFKNNKEELIKVWHTATCVSGIFIVPIILGLLIFHNQIARVFLNNSDYGLILVVFAFSLVFYVANNLLLNILNGLHQIKRYNLLNTLNSILGLLVTITLVYYYQVFGALLAIVTSQSITFFFILFFVRKEAWFRVHNFFGEFDKGYFGKLLGYTAMSLTSICVIPASQMFVRSLLASHTSWDAAGCWQGIQRISDSYLMIVYTALGTYFLPKLASLNDRAQISLEINRGYKIIMPFVIGVAIIIYFLRDFFIHLLFAKTFMAMRDMFFWQLVGDCFKIASYILAYLMLAKSKTKLFMITEILFGVGFVGISYFLINLVGINGAVMAFAINYFLYFMLFVIFYKRGYT